MLIAGLVVMCALQVTPPVASVLSALGKYEEKRGYWLARCPAHNDREPSLSVSVGKNGAAILNCHAGCAAESVVSALGMKMSDLFPKVRGNGSGPPLGELVATYDYVDENGKLLYQSCRYIPKTFRQRMPDSTKP